MSTLTERLHPKHFASGWPVFCRINGPFFVALGHGGGAVWLGLKAHQRYAESFLERWPLWGDSVVAVACIFSLGVFVVLWPLAALVRRRVRVWLESDFWEAQFSILNTLKKMIRWVSALMVVFFLFSVQEVWVWDAPWRRVALVSGASVLMTAMVVSIGLYGWFADQWRELKTGEPR